MVKAFPLNQQEYSYNAQDVSYYYAGRHSGVFALDTNCQVSIVSNMTIKVAKGKGWLAHGVDYGVVFWMEEDVLLTVPVGDVASPRWDYVCVGWETTEVKENPTIYIKSGSPAVTPAEPTLENSANKIEICLAKIYVPSGTTNLRATDVTLTDTRADKAYCGLVGDDLRTTNLEERATSLENRTTSLEGRASGSETEINKIKNGTTPVGKATKLENARTINGYVSSLPPFLCGNIRTSIKSSSIYSSCIFQFCCFPCRGCSIFKVCCPLFKSCSPLFKISCPQIITNKSTICLICSCVCQGYTCSHKIGCTRRNIDFCQTYFYLVGRIL